MSDKLSAVFHSMKIEYYAILPYSRCIETSAAIRARAGFEPRSVIVYVIPYYTGETVNLSRYAASYDYHIIIREIGECVISHLRAIYPDASFRSFGDHSPIDERHAALIGGLGIAGDNGLLINEKYGSYVFIGDVITDIPPADLGAMTPVIPATCEHCSACRTACPTGILRAEGSDCLSAITQRKGTLTREEISLMRAYNTAWGCDECQTVCPHNLTPTTTPLDFFYRDRISDLTRDILENMSDGEFAKRAFAWRGRATVERNLHILSDD